MWNERVAAKAARTIRMANRYLRTATGGLHPQLVINNSLQGHVRHCWLSAGAQKARQPRPCRAAAVAAGCDGKSTASWQSQQTHQVIHQVNLKNLEQVTAQQRDKQKQDHWPIPSAVDKCGS